MKRRTFLKFPSFGLALHAPSGVKAAKTPADEEFLRTVKTELQEYYLREIGVDGLSSAGIRLESDNNKVIVGQGHEYSRTELNLHLHFFWGRTAPGGGLLGSFASLGISVFYRSQAPLPDRELVLIGSGCAEFESSLRRCELPEHGQLAFILKECELTPRQCQQIRMAARPWRIRDAIDQ